jgi:UDP-glucose:(heptosyl)LPS alpha-1,3-glucosyltransferase
MKIALVNKAFSSRQGGGERYAVNLARALCREGHEVHLFGSLIEDVPHEAQCHLINAPRWPAFRRILAFSVKVHSYMKNYNFDIVYGLTQYYPVDLYRMGGGVYKHWMSLRYDTAIKKWLSYLINPIHLCHLYLEAQIFNLHHHKQIIANSHLCKHHALLHYGIPEDRVNVIYTGVDKNIFNINVKDHYRDSERKRLGIDKDKIVLLFVSHNWKRKGLETIMRALNYAGKEAEDYMLVCVGKSKRRPFEKLAHINGLIERVIFCPPSQEIEKYYALADIFVLPTLYDPFSNVCLEAMSCGVPVITSASNGASEIIDNGVSGYILNNARDFKTLAYFLKELTDENLRLEMGRKAVRRSESFTIEKNLAHTLTLFHKLITHRNL